MDEAGDVSVLDALSATVRAAWREWVQAIERLDGAGDTLGMAEAVRALMFVQRFEQAIEKRHDELGQ